MYAGSPCSSRLWEPGCFWEALLHPAVLCVTFNGRPPRASPCIQCQHEGKALLVPRAHRTRATGLQGVADTKVLLSDVGGAKLLQRDMEAGLRKSQGMGSGNMM